MNYLFYLIGALFVCNTIGFADDTEFSRKRKETSRAPSGLVSAQEYLHKHPKRGKFYNSSPEFKFAIHPLIGDMFAHAQHFPKTFVLTIPKGRVAWGAGLVITRENHLLKDTAIEWDRGPHQHRILEEKHLPKARSYRAQVAVLSSNSAHCYYHWMFDILPKLKLLEDAGAKVDYYYLQYDNLPFQNETLDILKIDRKNIIQANNLTLIEAKTLIVPSLPGSSMCPPKWVYDFLRSKFLIDPPNDHSQRIYVSRGMAQTRRIVNEGQVNELLESYGFKMYYLETMPLVEQARLFASAEIIVTPHGSALTNLAFCSPNTHLIEVLPPNNINPCFWHVSQQMGVHHICHLGSQDSLPGENVKREDMVVDIQQLKQELDQILGQQ